MRLRASLQALRPRNLGLLAGALADARVGILMYHSVSDNAVDPWSVSVSSFASQMEWLRRRHFTVLPLDEVIRNLDDNKRMRKCIAITFDDGYADFLHGAAPILSSYGFPSTMFVLAGPTGGVSYWEKPHLQKPLLDSSGLREILRHGCSIGSHGMTHSDLTGFSNAELEFEIVQSKRTLEQELGVHVNSFAYPWGRVSEREARAVAQAGYLCGVVAWDRWGIGPESPRFMLGRKAVGSSDTLQDFAKTVLGWKSVLSRYGVKQRELRRL